MLVINFEYYSSNNITFHVIIYWYESKTPDNNVKEGVGSSVAIKA